MIDDLLGGAGLWSPLSDVIHNKEDDGWRIMLGLTFGTGNPHKDSYIGLHSLGAVLGVVTLTGVIEAYTGWDLSATQEANDPLCQLWAAGAGMLDDLYRDQVREQRRRDGSTEQLAQFFSLAAEQIAADGTAGPSGGE